MVGRTPAEAVHSYVQPIQRTLSCVTDYVADVGGGYYPADFPHSLLVNRGNPVGLSGTSRLSLDVAERYRLSQSGPLRTPWTVSVVGYYYSIQDEVGREVLSYHWHPSGQSNVTSPHLHIGHGAMASRSEFQNAHLPTGVVSVAEVIRLLIRDFDVTPLRNDWEEVLDSL